MKKSIISIIIIILIVVIAGLVLITSQKEKPATLTHLRIGYQPSIHHLAHMMAMEKNWWREDLKKFGIEKVTEYEFASGPPEMTAMLAGELDIAYVGAAPPITAIYEGLDAKIVAGVNSQGSNLICRPDINYQTPQDLKGLKIATFPPGSIQDTVLRKWQKDNGLDPGQDLEIAPMGPGDAISAIRARAVDCAFLPHPAPAVIELENTGKVVMASGEMWPDHACCVLLASGKLIREYPHLVEEIIKIHIKATEYVKSHPEESAQLYARKMGWDVDKIRHSLNTWDGDLIYSPYIGLESILEFAKVIYELNQPRYTELLNKKDLFDTSFYDRIKD